MKTFFWETVATFIIHCDSDDQPCKTTYTAKGSNRGAWMVGNPAEKNVLHRSASRWPGDGDYSD